MRVNPNFPTVPTSPILETYSWLEGRSFPAERPLLDVSQAAPDYPPAPELRRHLAAAMERPETFRYTPVPGLGELREALAADLGRTYGVAPALAEVAITAGCNQAFCLATTVLAEPGSEVLLPLPYYFNHDMWLRLQGIRPVYLPAGPGLVPEPEAAAERLSERSRAIVLVTPNNPSGAIYPSDTLDAFFELAERHGIHLIVDETYRDFRPPGEAPHRLFGRSGWQRTLVHLYSFSKVLAIPGLRVGAVVAARELQVEIGKAADCVAICTPRSGQEAALFGLRRLDGWRREKRREMAARLETFRSLLGAAATGYEIAAAGGYFAYLRHPFAGGTGREVSRRLLERHHVLCLAGEMFGPEQEAYLRFAFANLERPRLPDLIGRLRASRVEG